jgi:hypothetical protein
LVVVTTDQVVLRSRAICAIDETAALPLKKHQPGKRIERVVWQLHLAAKEGAGMQLKHGS